MTDLATAAPESVREHLALALDVDDLVVALRIARELQPWFSTAKVGLELFGAVGPESVGALRSLGYAVFLDLKLHDIPNTVRRASRVLASLGASYLTMHTSGGEVMLRAGVEGLAQGAERAGLEPPVALGVTVLTSHGDAPAATLSERVLSAAEAGCAGLVCAASDLREARQHAPRLKMVVPGIRPAGAPSQDQSRVATPREAMDAGADLLVIGRAVTEAADPPAAAAAIAAELSA